MGRRRRLIRLLMVALLVPLLLACGSDGGIVSSPTPTTIGALAFPSPPVNASHEAARAKISAAKATPDSVEAAYTKDNPPAVANTLNAQQYSGTTIIYYGSQMATGQELDRALAQKFSEETGINIEVVLRPKSKTETYAIYQRLFWDQSPDIDVMIISSIWPGAFAQHLVDLNERLDREAQQHYSFLIENNTIGGKLVAMPYYSDFGMLYYRTDLLAKYGFDMPPATWDELEAQAATIMAGERPDNVSFTGFVFQGNAYEGLTSNVLEWIASSGGGTLIENGQVTLNNPQAVAILNQARAWVGTIAPQAVTGYIEEDARNVFQGGNAAFMRNWLYAYPLGQSEDSAIRGRFDVASLPTAAGQQPVATVDGWQLGVSKYSRNQDAAIEFVRYMTSPEVQTYRAVVGSYVPTIPSVAVHPNVLAAMPYLEHLAHVRAITRPAHEIGEHYNEASAVIYQSVNEILKGQDATQIVPQIAQRLQQFVR